MSRIVIREPVGYSPQALATYATLGSVHAAVSEADFLRELSEAEVLVIRLKEVDKAVLDAAPKLKMIASPTTGLNHIDLTEVEKRGIKIVSLKGRRDITEKIFATSELTIGLILGLLRRLPWAHGEVMAGGWEREKFVGSEISGKTIGLLGCGRLGSRVAEILQAMGAKILAHDPYQKSETVPVGVELVSLDELLKQSDILSIHAYLTEETTGMMGEESFAKMKSGAFLVNTARGQIIDEAALLRALETGRLAGAALDVMTGEAQDAAHLRNNALLEYAKTHDNLLIVPHIGGATRESMGLTEEAIAREVVEEMKKYGTA